MIAAPHAAPVDQLITGFYRAASGDLPWAEVLAAVAALFAAWGVHLMVLRPADGSFLLSQEAGPGMTPEGALDYLRRYHRIDPRVPLILQVPQHHWISCHEHFGPGFVARSPFYRDFLIPYGGRYVSATRVYDANGVMAVLGIHRGFGSQPLNVGELALAQRLGHHLQAALGLWLRQRTLVQRALVGHAVLSRLAQPVLLLDGELRLHHCNGAARRMLDTDPRLRESQGRVVCASAHCQTRLQAALQQLTQAAGAPAATADRALVRLGAKTAGPGDLVLMALRLRAAETMGAFGSSNLVLALLHDTAAQGAADAQLVAAAYDLTPAEAQVAVRVAAGDSPKDIARTNGVSVHTVRSQLTAVFSKTGVCRQAELAAMLSALPALGDGSTPRG